MEITYPSRCFITTAPHHLLASPLEEYGVTPEQVERAAQRDLAAIRKERKSGRLRPWKRKIRGAS